MNLLDAPIDFFLLAYRQSPGIAEFPSGASSPRKWDKRKGYGVSGGGLVYVGDDLAAFVVKIRLIDSADWQAWEAFSPLLIKAPAGQSPKAMDFWHPITEAHGISSVVVEDFVGPVQTDTGEWSWDIKFLTFRLPKAALAKPAASATKPTPPKSDGDLLIERLEKQVQDLARAPT